VRKRYQSGLFSIIFTLKAVFNKIKICY
jgi:hypothetical protein